MQTVLVIDDDAALRDTIGLMLETEGFRPALAEDGRTGIKQAMALKPDLVLVDLRMPGLSGIEVCKQMRGAGMKTPLIVLSAIGDEMDKVLLLEIGADDYVVKPFGTRELLARIRALLRRSSTEETKVLSFGDVQVDLTRRVVTKKNEEMKLTRAEYNLLTYFLQNPDRALSRDMILNSVWGYESFPNTRTVDAHVVRLRQKLERDAGRPAAFSDGARCRIPLPAVGADGTHSSHRRGYGSRPRRAGSRTGPDARRRAAHGPHRRGGAALPGARSCGGDICAVITDLHLPQMDGFELIEAVRSHPGRGALPILVISGDSDPGTPSRLEALGANAYFQKPFSPIEVRNRLEQLIYAS